MKSTIAVIGIACLQMVCISSCAALTPAGQTIRIVTEQERDAHCHSLGPVTGYSLGCANCAMNDARNQTAKLGGNGIRIISTTNSNGDINVFGEALRCEFRE